MGGSLEDVVGLGVGIPAPVDTATGMISVPDVMRGWEDVHIGQVMSERLGRPVYVDNDANLGALAESTLGASSEQLDSVFVRASYGTGAGIIINRQLHRGFAGTAGEIGHVQLDPQGNICRCGSRGCLDTVVGAGALIDALRSAHGNLTLRDVISRANAGDRGCAQVIADAGATIGGVVASLAVAVNPQRVVVGGELAETGELLLAPLRDAVERRVLPNRVAPMEVVPGALGGRAEVVGAMVLALQSTDVSLAELALAGADAEAAP
jgi:predicted NBD/HSP70 family sugar kinase